MKKYFICAFAVLTSVVMFSCKEKTTPGGGETPVNPGETTDLQVVMNVHELQLTVGDQEKVRASVKPAKEGVTISFKSDNETVVSVTSAGVVTALAEGTANIIASAEGATSDTCVVLVNNSAMFDDFQLVGYGLFGDFETIPGTDTIIELVKGPANVNLNTIWLYAWDGDVMYATGGWTGQGLVMEAEVAVYVITAGDSTTASGYGNAVGYYVGAGGFYIADLESAGYEYLPYYAQSGKIDVENYGKFMHSLITAEKSEDIDIDAANAMIKGAYLFQRDMNQENPDYWYYPYAVVNRLEIVENDDDSFDIGFDLTWSDIASEDRFFGLKVTFDEQGNINGIASPYDYATVGPIHYGSISFDKQAPRKYYLGDMTKVHKELPSFATKNGKSIKTDRLYRAK